MEAPVSATLINAYLEAVPLAFQASSSLHQVWLRPLNFVLLMATLGCSLAELALRITGFVLLVIPHLCTRNGTSDSARAFNAFYRGQCSLKVLGGTLGCVLYSFVGSFYQVFFGINNR